MIESIKKALLPVEKDLITIYEFCTVSDPEKRKSDALNERVALVAIRVLAGTLALLTLTTLLPGLPLGKVVLLGAGLCLASDLYSMATHMSDPDYQKCKALFTKLYSKGEEIVHDIEQKGEEMIQATGQVVGGKNGIHPSFEGTFFQPLWGLFFKV